MLEIDWVKDTVRLLDVSTRLWNVATGREERTLTGHAGTVNCVAFSLNGRLVVSGGDDQALIVWDMASGRVEGVLTVKDLLGALVGDLPDEFDPDDEPDVVRVDGSRWLVDGRMSVDDLRDSLDINIPEGEYSIRTSDGVSRNSWEVVQVTMTSL